jgi:hypothetical protein
MGEILMSKRTKYKSVGVSDNTYQMIIEIAKKEKRKISQQLAIIVEEQFNKSFQEELMQKEPANNIYGGISSAFKD